jgi:hypothetical protein
MKRPAPPLRRDPHPTLETFERVLYNGVMVDRGPEDRRRSMWSAVPLGGADLLHFDIDVWSLRNSHGRTSSDRDD